MNHTHGLSALLISTCAALVPFGCSSDPQSATGSTSDAGGPDGSRGPTCPEVCVKVAAACPMSEDCAPGCTMGDSVGRAACPDVYSAFLGCTDQHPASQCDGSSTCSAEQQAFQVCVTKECAADPSKCGQ